MTCPERRNRWLLTGVLAAALTAAGATGVIGEGMERGVERQPQSKASADSIRLPPGRVEHTSADGRYAFVVSTSDGWASKQAQGKLVGRTGNADRVLWEGTLPQEYGPRYVLVSPQGRVLMLDEWINVKSRYAVSLLDSVTGAMEHRDFEAVQRAVGVPAATLVASARGGWWVAGEPQLDASGTAALVPAGGELLRIDLLTGALSSP